VIRTVYAKWLWDNRRTVLGWTIAIVVVGAGYAAFWPTFEDPEVARLLENYPSALLEALNYTNITTPEGYLGATVYGLVVAVLMAVFAIAAGSQLIAGEEESGVLDLTLSYPVSRTTLGLQRVAALTTSVVVIVAVFWLAMLAIAGPAKFDSIPASRFAAMHLHLAAFALLFGTLAYGIGAAFGRRTRSIAVPAAVAVLAYAASGILPQVDGLEWIRDWSAFTWLNGNSPLTNGIDWTHLGIMLGLSATFVVFGTLAFQRRDVAV
jgi:beta-exotoxin I transport system permease protein